MDTLPSRQVSYRCRYTYKGAYTPIIDMNQIIDTDKSKNVTMNKPDEKRQGMKVRTVVTGHNAKGRAVFVRDEKVDGTPIPGLGELAFLWSANEPATYPNAGNNPAAPGVFPPLGGIRFIIGTYLPGDFIAPEPTPEMHLEDGDELGGANPVFHRTDTTGGGDHAGEPGPAAADPDDDRGVRRRDDPARDVARRGRGEQPGHRLRHHRWPDLLAAADAAGDPRRLLALRRPGALQPPGSCRGGGEAGRGSGDGDGLVVMRNNQ